MENNNNNNNQNIGLFTKIILFLYLIVGLSPKVVEIEYEGFQWLYFSILNILSLAYIYSKRELFNPFSLEKKANQFFILFLLFLGVSLFSISQATVVSESLVHISRLINVIVGIYVIYILVRSNPKEFFEFVCRVCVILLAYHSFVTLEHYIGNYSKPRNIDLYETFLHYYGNINIFTASLIVKLPFAIYLFFISKNKIWKIFSAIIILTTILSLLFAGSRTALLSVVLIMGLTLIAYLFLITKNKKKYISHLIFIGIIPFVSLFIMLNVNRVDKNKMNSVSNFYSYVSNDIKKTDRFFKKNSDFAKTNVILDKKEEDGVGTKLLKASGRHNIWTSAAIIFKQHPILGIGYGNFKMYPLEDYFMNKVGSTTYSKPIRVHNDFFEKFVETGVFGGILYLLLFIFILKLIRHQFKSDNKEIILFLFLSILAYSIDAFFNFPLERVPIQLFFVLVAAFVLAINYKETQKEKALKSSKTTQVLVISLALISILTVFSNYLTFKAYSVNTIIKNEKKLNKKGIYNFTYSGMNNLINDYPTLDQDGINMKYYLATYAAKEQKYDEALKILNGAFSDKSYNFLIKKQKAEIFLKGYKNLDSAEYYFKEVFKVYPSYKFNYIMLRNIYIGKKDTVNLENLMNRYTKSNYTDDVEWVYKANYYNKKDKDLSKAISILDTALAYNKKITLVEAKMKLKKYKNINTYINTKKTKKLYDEVITFYNKGKFSDAKKLLSQMLKDKPDDHFAVLYLGIMELSLKNYKKSIKYLTESINKNIFKEGKAEYCRAICYDKLGEKEKSKADYRAARVKKFPQALKLPESKYK